MKSSLIALTSAVSINGSPDAFGQNGQNYVSSDPSVDLSKIGIDIVKNGDGAVCKEGDWAEVHSKAYLKDGRLISDSRIEGDGRPKLFTLGDQQVFKCWDLAIPKLTQGTNAKISCPSEFVYGGAYTLAPLGGEPIPLNSEVNFELDIVMCNRTPVFPVHAAQPVTTTMQPNRGFFLHMKDSDSTNTDIVWSLYDYWAPTSWWPCLWILNDEKVADDDSQVFVYHEDEKTIGSLKYPNMRLVDYYGWPMMCNPRTDAAYSSIKRDNTQIYYDPVTSTLDTEIDGVKASLVTWGGPRRWSWSYFSPKSQITEHVASDWHIEYPWKNF